MGYFPHPQEPVFAAAPPQVAPQVFEQLSPHPHVPPVIGAEHVEAVMLAARGSACVVVLFCAVFVADTVTIPNIRVIAIKPANKICLFFETIISPPFLVLLWVETIHRD